MKLVNFCRLLSNSQDYIVIKEQNTGVHLGEYESRDEIPMYMADAQVIQILGFNHDGLDGLIICVSRE